MSEFSLFFQDSKSLYSSTTPPEIKLDEFEKRASEISVSEDIILQTNFAFTIGPYILNNYTSITKESIHLLYEIFPLLINSLPAGPAIYGIIEAIQLLIAMSTEIPLSFLDYFSQQSPNDANKIFLISSILDELDRDFLTKNGKYFSSLLALTIPNAHGRELAQQLLMASLIGESCGSLKKVIWDSLVRAACDEKSLLGFSIAINSLKERQMWIFDNTSAIISEKMDERKEDKDFILNLFRIGGLLAHDELKSLTSSVIEIISQYIEMEELPYLFFEVLRDFGKFCSSRQSMQTVHFISLQLAKTELYPAALVFLTLLRNDISRLLKIDDHELFELLKSGIENKYPMREPLLFAFSEISSSDFIISQRNWVIECGVPFLLEKQTEKSFDCLEMLIENGLISTPEVTEIIIQHFWNSKSYFNVLSALVHNDFTHENLVTALVGAKVIDSLTSIESSTPLALSTAREISLIDPEYKEPIIGCAKPVVARALEGNDPSAYLEAILFLEYTGDADELILKLISEICEMEFWGHNKRAIIVSSARLLGENFPFIILLRLIQSSDYRDQITAIETTQQLLHVMPQEQSYIVLREASLLARTTTESLALINAAFNLAADYCSLGNNDQISELINTVLLGRVAAFYHLQIWSTGYSKFKLFKFVREYIRCFKDGTVAAKLIPWISRVTRKMLRSLLKAFISNLEIFTDDFIREKLQVAIVNRINAEGKKTESLEILFDSLYKVCHDSTCYLQVLEEVWKKYGHKAEMRNLVAPRVIEYQSKYFTPDCKIMDEICRSIANGGIDFVSWSNSIAKLIDIKISRRSLALVLAKILISTRQWQEDAGLDKILMQKIFIMYQSEMKDQEISKSVEKHFGFSEENISRIRQQKSSKEIIYYGNSDTDTYDSSNAI